MTTPELRPLDGAFHSAARDRLRARAQGAGLDGLLLCHAPNIAYATGLFLSANERPMAVWLPVEAEPVLFMPELERENAAIPAIPDLRCYAEFPGETEPVLWMLDEIGSCAVGIDRLDARLLDPARARATRIDLVDHAMAVRAIKTPEELALTREAARFADLFLFRLLDRAGDIISQGGTEQDLMADAMDHARSALARTHGHAFSGTPLGITASVHSGPRAALPHGQVLNRVPQRSETLVAGIGGHLGGYHAESGATLIVGESTAEQRQIMAAMKACNDAGAAALAARETGTRINEAALDELRKAGLTDAIRHRIGHGMGLEGHEAPWLAPGDETRVAPGMVFSNEPGVYRPGRDGYRTINTMILDRDGVEIPSRFQSQIPIDARIVAL
ncbi:M24 family metallopeptidase [Ponticoccus litoralis]|uniref:Xaa-Pro peptidase family protein n=1 Tax=Ponticoccus litoralis TaxID=422297 RepID=A0AAW9SR11_9RHOB